MTRLFLALALLLAPVAAPAAPQPDEILKDPELEARARDVSEEIRCLVCRNESIDESNADLARDLRLLVRERIEAGDSNAQVKDYLVERYGEFVLLKPTFSAGNAAIWLAGPVLFVLGGLAAAAYLRSRGRRELPQERPLTAEEEAALARALGREDA
jgi:cytochrome c-type biogenesis protein CcmH